MGTGEPGFSGDGGPATDAQIYGPQAIALDEANGILAIADTTNMRLRLVDLATGIITTAAGTGTGAVNYDPNLTAAQTPITQDRGGGRRIRRETSTSWCSGATSAAS